MCCVSYRNGIQLTGYQWEVMIGAASYRSISEAQLSASIHSTAYIHTYIHTYSVHEIVCSKLHID